MRITHTHYAMMNHFAELKRLHAERGYIPPTKANTSPQPHIGHEYAASLVELMEAMLPPYRAEKAKRDELSRQAKERAKRNKRIGIIC